MKTLVTTLALLVLSFGATAQESGKSITVTIDNVQNSNGKVVFALHTEDTFMKANAVANAAGVPENGKVTVTFENVLPGEYAIIALHDENENGRMDYETNGMPKEAYGTSNNVMSFGPPQYSEAKFKVANENIEMNIKF